jgi:hypothetical protein
MLPGRAAEPLLRGGIQLYRAGMPLLTFWGQISVRKRTPATVLFLCFRLRFARRITLAQLCDSTTATAATGDTAAATNPELQFPNAAAVKAGYIAGVKRVHAPGIESEGSRPNNAPVPDLIQRCHGGRVTRNPRVSRAFNFGTDSDCRTARRTPSWCKVPT